MSTNKTLSQFAGWLVGAACAVMIWPAPSAQAQTVWSGPVTNYTQPSPNDGTAGTQDRITSHLWLTRANREAMFNAAPPSSEFSYDGTDSPKNTEWAQGQLSDYASLTYQPWPTVIGGVGQGPDAPLYMNLPNQPWVVHIISDNIYFSIVFSSWTPGGAGGYSYARSTAAAVVTPPSPTVSITNPAAGVVFSAPASLKLGATAGVSSGTVTNVAFFAGSTLLGSAKTSPFNVTGSSLGAGSYNLTAVATAAGISTTSAVVAINVVSAAPITNTVPVIAAGKFSFKYSANTGLTYVVQRAANSATNWVPISTNMATATSVTFSETNTTTGARFYSVYLQPNP